VVGRRGRQAVVAPTAEGVDDPLDEPFEALVDDPVDEVVEAPEPELSFDTDSLPAESLPVEFPADAPASMVAVLRAEEAPEPDRESVR
jgi:hypothetical protein